MTAIRQIELSEPLAGIAGLHGYSRCMVVLRWQGRVVGREFVPVTGGAVSAAALAGVASRGALFEALSLWMEESLGYDERSIPSTSLPSATVAVCTRERPQDLDRALSALAALRHPEHELLVVDNAPESSATREVAARFPNVKYVVEPRRGLNAARNRALAEATGEIVAFTDDDVMTEREWLDRLLANFSDRRVACATGLALPLELDTEAQELFEEHCSFVRGFRRRVFDAQWHNPLAAGPIGAGASMAIRRGVARQLGGFDERLDAGMPTRSGGDHEMFVRLLKAGHRIVYDPSAVSWHRHRRTYDELMDTVYGYGVGVYAMWTGLLAEHHETGVLRLAWRWFRRDQMRVLVPRRSGAGSSSSSARVLQRAELRGCLRGPKAWFKARRLRAVQT